MRSALSVLSVLAITCVLLDCGGSVGSGGFQAVVTATPTSTSMPTQGGSPSPSSGPSGCISSSAPPPPGIPALVYPAPGATAVPAGVGVLIFLALENYSTSAFTVTSASSSVPVAATAVPSPLPTALPSEPYYALAIPQLASHTTYVVNYTSGSGCSEQVFSLGSFTTQ